MSCRSPPFSKIFSGLGQLAEHQSLGRGGVPGWTPSVLTLSKLNVYVYVYMFIVSCNKKLYRAYVDC